MDPEVPRVGGRLPDVSVLVPTHQREHLLPRTLAAILDQDYPGDIEVIVTYDKCTPVFSHVRTTPGRTVTVISNDRTPGLAGARNSGALASHGEFLALCDDDDVWMPGKLELQVRRLLETGADVCVSGIEVVREKTSTTRVPQREQIRLGDLAASRIMEANPSTVLMRRDAFFDRVGFVDEELPGSYGEDYDWLLRAAAVTPLEVVRRPLVRIAWHSGSFFRTQWQTVIEAIDYGLDKHAVLRESRPGLARLYGRKAFAYAALGQGGAARHWARESLRLHRTEQRALLAILVSARVLPWQLVVRAAAAAGRGI